RLAVDEALDCTSHSQEPSVMLGLDQLSPTHREALESAVAYVADRYKPRAVVAAGTIIYGDPDQNSDLDPYVLHDQPYRQRVQRHFNGVPAEIFVNTDGRARIALVQGTEAPHPSAQGRASLDRCHRSRTRRPPA